MSRQMGSRASCHHPRRLLSQVVARGGTTRRPPAISRANKSAEAARELQIAAMFPIVTPPVRPHLHTSRPQAVHGLRYRASSQRRTKPMPSTARHATRRFQCMSDGTRWPRRWRSWTLKPFRATKWFGCGEAAPGPLTIALTMLSTLSSIGSSIGSSRTTTPLALPALGAHVRVDDELMIQQIHNTMHIHNCIRLIRIEAYRVT